MKSKQFSFSTIPLLHRSATSESAFMQMSCSLSPGISYHHPCKPRSLMLCYISPYPSPPRLAERANCLGFRLADFFFLSHTQWFPLRSHPTEVLLDDSTKKSHPNQLFFLSCLQALSSFANHTQFFFKDFFTHLKSTCSAGLTLNSCTWLPWAHTPLNWVTQLHSSHLPPRAHNSAKITSRWSPLQKPQTQLTPSSLGGDVPALP